MEYKIGDKLTTIITDIATNTTISDIEDKFKEFEYQVDVDNKNFYLKLDELSKEIKELKENHIDIETDLDNIIDKLNDLKVSNKKVVDIALINYSLIRLALEKNDENLEKMRKRTNTGLKIAGSCILIVSVILLVMLGSMFYLHFQ